MRSINGSVIDNRQALRASSVAVVCRVCQSIRPRRYRSMRQFAEQEFYIPDGDYEGTRFRADVQPAHGLYLDEIDSGNWSEHYLLASQQSGKSVAGFLIPTMYHLFERGQTVICGVPLLDMRTDKWKEELFPAIEASRYRDLLPKSGASSKGGVPSLIQFLNGASLRFMTGGGNDKTRASFTAPVLVTTETEGFADVSNSSSERVSALDQLRGRVSHYGSRSKIYHECTVTTESGVMAQGHRTGSGGQVVWECPGCGECIHPERDNLVGWDGHDTELRAKNATRWSCPRCGLLITEDARRAALKSARILHRGQRVEAGLTVGDAPETQVLSVRYGASANAFSEVGQIGLKEWRAKFQEPPETSEASVRALLQWTYATPVKSETVKIDPLDVRRLMSRQSDTSRGFCPADTELLTAGCDIRKTQLHWVVIAWTVRGPRIVDFGIERIPSSEMPIGEAILSAGEIVQDLFRAGFPVAESDAVMSVAQVLCDSGYQTDDVDALTAKDDVWMSAMGFGSGMLRDKKYSKPRSDRAARIIGNAWHIAEVRGRLLVELDANKQKSALHRALAVEEDSPYALLLPKVVEQDLRDFVYELTAEEQQDRWKPGFGVITEWKQTRRHNHFLDAAYQAYVAREIHEEIGKLLQQDEPEEIEWNPEVTGGRGGIFG